jgi:hypothetical protein
MSIVADLDKDKWKAKIANDLSYYHFPRKIKIPKNHQNLIRIGRNLIKKL